MKICLVNESFPPVIDGVVNVVMNYADHLIADHDSQVIVGTPAYPGADYTKYAYPVVPYQSFNTGNMTSGYRAGNPFAAKAIAELAAFKPDIIHSHCPASSTVMSRILREETGAPIVFTYHTKYDIDIERWVKVKAIAEEGIKAMVSNIEAVDEVWVVSRGAGESLKALGFRGDYRVMNNGVDFAKGRVDADTVAEVTSGYDLPEGIPMFLFVGRLMTYKGLPLILDALKMISDKGRDFRMVFVGKGPDQELLQKKAEELGIASKCIFVGPVYDRDKLRAWNTRADLFLFPSTFDTNGLVVREAAACGLASVLIRNSCAAEGVTDSRNGFIIDENAESMAELLMKVSGNLPYLHEIGQHAMDEIYLSWKDCVSEVYDRYQILLDKKNSGLLPDRRMMAADYLLNATAKSLEEQEKMRRLEHEVFHDFRETAIGMMENIQEAEESVANLGNEITEKVKDSVKGSAEDVRAGMQEVRAGMHEVHMEAHDAKELFKQNMADGAAILKEEVMKDYEYGVAEAAERKELREEKKAERKELREEKKAERKELHEEKKAEIIAAVEERKEAVIAQTKAALEETRTSFDETKTSVAETKAAIDELKETIKKEIIGE